MPENSPGSSKTKARRSIITASFLAISAGGTAVPAIHALQGGSIVIAAVLGAYTVAAAVGAFMGSRASYRWLRLEKAERPRTDVSRAVALSDAQEHMIYAAVGNDPKERELAEAELRAAIERHS